MFKGNLKTIIKGFTVPSGYVLHYEDKFGNDLVAQEGDYVNTTHKFKEVIGGSVSGWNLQRKQSSFDFSKVEEDDDVEFEDHTLTPWGDRVDVLGIPLLKDDALSAFNKINKLGGLKAKLKYPEIDSYIVKLGKALETYGVSPNMPDQEILDKFDLVNRNIQLLLVMENTEFVKNLFTIENAPNILDEDLSSTLIETKRSSVNLSKLSHGLLTGICEHYDISPEDFTKEVGKGMSRKMFEDKYGEYIRSNAIKVGDKFTNKEEAQDFIKQTLQAIPQEVRPLVASYLNAQDLINNDINTLIQNIKDSEYLFNKEVTTEDLEYITPLVEIDLADLPRVKVAGTDYIPGRFEYTRRLLSVQALDLIRKDTEQSTDQSVGDVISEVIENYIEYLGGDLSTYKLLCESWISSRSNPIVRIFYSWAAGENTAEVRAMKATFSAIQTAHSAVFEILDTKVYRVMDAKEGIDRNSIPKLSIHIDKPVVSFSLSRSIMEPFENSSANQIMMEAKTSYKRVLLIPGLYMPQPYWKMVNGKTVFVNRSVSKKDDNMEVVIKSDAIFIKEFKDNVLEVVL